MIFDKIQLNKSLVLIDADTEKRYQVKEILFDLNSIKNKEKQLVFLYSNKRNKISTIGVYFSFLKSNFTIALLDEGLDEELKNKLEKDYYPNIIIDDKRSNIRDFSKMFVKSEYFEIELFRYKKESNIILNKNIKLLLSTSGTTGSPKFVKLSDENLVQNSTSIINYLPIVKEDVCPLNLPLFYSYGLSVLHSNAIAGGEVVCNCEDVLGRLFWKQFESFGFTSIAGVPFIYEMLDRIGFRKKQYHSLKYITQAGGNLNEKIKQRFLNYCLDNSVDFYVMYGQTEATARISYVPPKDLKENINSIGKPILNGILFLDNETNELLYKGPNVFGGYADSYRDLISWIDQSKLRTGDLARKDEKGFYYITGRLKRFIKVFGNRVNLDELETFLKFNLDGANFACLGKEDKYIIVFCDTKSVSLDVIRKVVMSKLKIHSSIIKHNYINSFPLTSNGKINYKELKNSYEI